MDDRAVSPIIGFIFVMAFAVMAVSTFQIYILPSENQEIEFNHYQSVQDDMIELRNAIMEASQVLGLRSVTVQLGTEYPARAVNINPASPTGTLSTEPIGDEPIWVEGANATALCGLGEEPRTKTINYTPHYQYIEPDEAPSIVYENSVVYRSTTDGTLFHTDQVLVRDDKINLVPLLGNISETSGRARSIEFEADGAGSAEISDSFTLTLPTRLPAETWESELLADQNRVKNVTQNTSTTVDINFKAGFYTVRCAPAGSDTSPETDISSSDQEEINPAAPGNIKLEEEVRDDNHVVGIRLNNTAGLDIEIDAARINFYHDSAGQGNEPYQADLTDDADSVRANLVFRDDFEDLDPPLVLAGNGTVTHVKLKFYGEDDSAANIDTADWLVVTFLYSNDQAGTYFIPIPK